MGAGRSNAPSHISLLWVPVFLVLLEFAAYASNDMMLPAMPEIIHTFGGGLSQISLSVSLYIFGCCLVQLFIAPFADYYGHKQAILFGAAYFFVTALITALSDSMSLFLFFRLIAGASMGFISLGYSITHSLYDDRDATRITSLMQNFTIISPILGPMIGVFILKSFSWHYIFFLNAAIGLISFLGIRVTLPAIPAKKQKPQIKRIVADYWTILRKRTFILGALACLSISLPYLVWISFSTTTIKELLQLSDFQYIMLQCMALGGAFFSTIAIHLTAGRWPFPKIILLGILTAVIGLSFAVFEPGDIYVIAFGMMIYGFGSGLFTTLAVRIVGTIPFHNPAMIFTLFTFIQLGGFFLGISLMEPLFEARGYAADAFGICNGAMMLFVLLFCGGFAYVTRKRQWQ